MGVLSQQTTKNRQSITTAAENLVREWGVNAVRLAERTKAADFTQDCFYKQLESENALMTAVMNNAMKNSLDRLLEGIEESDAMEMDPIKRQIDSYLSSDHWSDVDSGFLVSAFAGSARRLGTGGTLGLRRGDRVES